MAPFVQYRSKPNFNSDEFERNLSFPVLTRIFFFFSIVLFCVKIHILISDCRMLLDSKFWDTDLLDGRTKSLTPGVAKKLSLFPIFWNSSATGCCRWFTHKSDPVFRNRDTSTEQLYRFMRNQVPWSQCLNSSHQQSLILLLLPGWLYWPYHKMITSQSTFTTLHQECGFPVRTYLSLFFLQLFSVETWLD